MQILQPTPRYHREPEQENFFPQNANNLLKYQWTKITPFRPQSIETEASHAEKFEQYYYLLYYKGTATPIFLS